MRGVESLFGVALLALGAAPAARAEEPPLETGIIHWEELTVVTDPLYATSAAPVRLVVTAPEDEVFLGCPYFGWHAPTVEGHGIQFFLDAFGCPSAQSHAAATSLVTRHWDVGTLPPGTYAVRFVTYDDWDLTEARTVSVHDPDTVLRLRGDEFSLTMARPGGAPSIGVPLSDESGYFTFFSASNVEVTVKILDGRGVNGHYWVFVASMTDTPFDLTVLQNRDHCLDLPTDPKTVCPWRTYSAAAGHNQNFIDVEFPLEPPSAGSR